MNYYVERYFWLIAIAVEVLYWADIRYDVQPYMDAMSDKRKGYKILLRGFLFWRLLPLVIMGIGFTIGQIPNIWHYFKPQDGNIYVLSFYAAVALLHIGITIWLFLFKGAKTLADHPGIIRFYSFSFRRMEVRNPTIIKTKWLSAHFVFCVAAYLMWQKGFL